QQHNEYQKQNTLPKIVNYEQDLLTEINNDNTKAVGMLLGNFTLA
ncbi:2544_t:CDS:1, partial [Gigaspora margarita]